MVYRGLVTADVAPTAVTVSRRARQRSMLFGRERRVQVHRRRSSTSTALFLDILDTTIVNVAIPTLGREFHTDNAEWVVLGYTLSLAVWIPASGWLGDRFGTKRTFLFAFDRVHRRFAAVRRGAVDRAADRVPGAAGRRRRDADARSAWRCCSGRSRRPSGPGRRRSS